MFGLPLCVSLGSRSHLRLTPPSSYTGCAWHQDGGGPASPVVSFFGTLSLEGSLRHKVPKSEDLLNRATVEHMLLLTQAIAFIGSLILSTDIGWLCVLFCKKLYNGFSPYQAGTQDVGIRWVQLFLLIFPSLRSSRFWLVFHGSTFSNTEGRLRCTIIK